MRSRIRIALLTLILVAFGWRVQGLANQSLWRDEVDAVWFATRPLQDTLNMFTVPGQNGVLYFLALRPWFVMVGSSEFALRFVSAMAGTLSVILLWQVARTIAPSRIGEQAPDEALAVVTETNAEANVRSVPDSAFAIPILAATFLALNPYQLWYSQEGKMYTVTLALVLLSAWFFWQGTAKGGWRPWLGFAVVVTVAIYTHLLLILLYPFFFVWFLIAWPLSRKRWLGYSTSMVILILPYIPMALWQWDLLTTQQQMTGFSFTPPKQMLLVLLENYSRGFMNSQNSLWLAPVYLLGAAGLILGPGEIARRQQSTHGAPGVALASWRRYAMLVIWLAAPVALIYLLSLRQPIFTDRYVFWIAPAAMVFLALGVSAIWRHAGSVLRYAGVALAVYVALFWAYAGWQQKTLPMKYDLRSGVAYLTERRSPDSLLLLQIPHLQYAVRYYSSDFGARPFEGSDARIGRWADGLWTNNGWSDDQARALADQQMRELTAGLPEVWVLRSEIEMWDQRHLMEDWLLTHGRLADAADFHGVGVRRYILGESQ